MTNLDGTDLYFGERLLAQRSLGWKLACSVWVLIVGVGFVFFSVLGWAIGAALSGSRRMWNFTGMWFALYIVAIVAIKSRSDDSDAGVVVELAASHRLVITIEDGCIMGGMGSAVLEFMADHGYHAQVKRLGIPDAFIEHGTQAELYAECGFDDVALVAAVKEMLGAEGAKRVGVSA